MQEHGHVKSMEYEAEWYTGDKTTVRDHKRKIYEDFHHS